MTKKVNKGQRLNGNVSASAMNYLNKLVGQDKQSLLNKPGGPHIGRERTPNVIDGIVHSGEVSPGDAVWVYTPLLGGSEYDSPNWLLGNVYRVALPGTIGGFPANARVSGIVLGRGKTDDVVRVQVGGIARCKIHFPAAEDPQTAVAYETANLGGGPSPGVPVAVPTSRGDIRILWRENPTFGGTTAGTQWCSVYLHQPPMGERPVMASFNATGLSGTAGFSQSTMTIFFTDVAGEGAEVVGDRLKLLRGGYRDVFITAHCYRNVGGSDPIPDVAPQLMEFSFAGTGVGTSGGNTVSLTVPPRKYLDLDDEGEPVMNDLYTSGVQAFWTSGAFRASFADGAEVGATIRHMGGVQQAGVSITIGGPLQ